MIDSDRLADKIVFAVADLPDRTSPDDWPEAMLVTADELRAIVIASVEACPGCGASADKVTRGSFPLCIDCAIVAALKADE